MRVGRRLHSVPVCSSVAATLVGLGGKDASESTPERRLEGHRSQKPSLLRALPGLDCTCSEPANLRGKCWVVDTSVPSLCCKNVTPLQQLAPREDRSGGKTGAL